MVYAFDQETYLKTGEKVTIEVVITKGKEITYRLYDGRVFAAEDFFPAPEPKKRTKKKIVTETFDFPEQKPETKD